MNFGAEEFYFSCFSFLISSGTSPVTSDDLVRLLRTGSLIRRPDILVYGPRSHTGSDINCFSWWYRPHI